jgi:type VI secretion system secreted protein Hcp
MAGTMFIDFGTDIKGDSSDTESKGMIIIQSFSIGGSNPTSATRANNEAATVGRVQLGDMSISKEVDKTTPTIFSFMCQGKQLAKVTLYMYKASQSGSDTDFIKITMTKVVVSSHNVSGSDGNGSESFSLNYGTIVTQVTPSAGDTGKPGTAVPKGWDLTAQKVKDK